MELENTLKTFQNILLEMKGLKLQEEALANGDYLKDGLIYCGKCDSPKETIAPYFGKVTCMCKCESDEYKNQQEKQKKEERRIELQNKRGYCFDSLAMSDWTFEKCTIKDDPLYNTAYDYAKNFETMLNDGEGLLFFGNVGTGKTYLAASIANDIIEQGYTARMTNFATIDAELKDRDGSPAAYIKDLMNNDLLIIDDFDAERSTGYMQEIVHNIIDRRHTARKPLIVTTNLSAAELKNAKDRTKSRIYSRMLDMTIPVGFDGKDMRVDSLKEKYSKYKDILRLPEKKQKEVKS